MNSEIHTLSDRFTIQKGKNMCRQIGLELSFAVTRQKHLGASVGFVSKIDSKSNLKKTPNGRV